MIRDADGSDGDGIATPRPGNADSTATAGPRNERVSSAGNGAEKTNPWAGLLETGLAFLKELSQAARPRADGDSPRPDTAETMPHSSGGLVRRDPETGESYLRLPVPNPQVLDQILSAASALLERVRS